MYKNVSKITANWLMEQTSRHFILLVLEDKLKDKKTDIA